MKQTSPENERFLQDVGKLLSIKMLIEEGTNEHFDKNIDATTKFITFTGPLPEDPEAREKILAALKPLENYYFSNSDLEKFYKLSIYNNINKAYKNGKLVPELVEIINDKYSWSEKVLKNFLSGEQNKSPLDLLIEQGRVNFEPFRGPKDTGERWYINYRVTFRPLPLLYGQLDKTGKSYQRLKDGLISETVTNTLRLLNGVKTPNGETLLKPIAAGIMENYAAAIELQYQQRKENQTPRNSKNTSGKLTPDFYVNPETGRVYDLRPYKKQLDKMLIVKNWDFLAVYAATIRAAIAEFKGETAGKKKQPPGSIFDKAFIKMFNAAPINNLININTSKSGRPQEESGYFEQNMFTKEWEYKKGGTELNMPVKHGEGNSAPLFTTSTVKTIHFISLLFTAQNSVKHRENIFPVVDTSVREYMLATGRKITANSIKDATKTMKRDLDTMADISVRSNDKKYSLSRINPFAETHINRGKIRVVLAPTFAEFLVKTTGFLMNYPAALLKLKENNSSLYPLGYKLALNRSNDANIRRGKANILSVPVCLECCPGIPSIEKVRKGGRSPANRIIEPFEKAMDALQQQGVLERWEYCLPKGEPLKQAAITDYNYFSSLYILYEIKDFPIKNELPRIQAAAERRQKKQERIDRLTEKEIARKRAKAE